MKDICCNHCLNKIDQSILPEQKEFSAKNMLEFANWFYTVTQRELDSYIEHLKAEEEKSYQLYLTLKAKYEK